MKEVTRHRDNGIAFGGGAWLELGPGDVELDLRLTQGLTEVFEPAVGVDAKHLTIGCSIGYSLHLVRGR